MKKFLVVFMVILSVFALAKVKVTFWHAMGGGHGKTLQEIVNTFNELHPDIEVEAVYVGNYGALSQKLLAAAQAGELPTIAQSYSNWTAKLIQSGVVQPLNEFVNDPKIGLTREEWEDVFKPLRDNCMWGDTVYAVPFNKSLYILYYNADAFAMYGVDVPKTIDELYEAARIMTEDLDGDGKIDQYGFGFRTTVDFFQILLILRGGSILKQVDGKWVSNIDSQETREVLAFVKKMVDDGIAYFQGGYLNDIFGQQKIMMYIDTIAGRPYVESSTKGKFTWSWAPVPTWVTNKVPFAGTDIIMFNTASDEEKRAAWEFMKYLISPEVTAYWAINTGYIPVRRSALETSIWKEAAKSDPLIEIPLKQIDNAVFDPQIGVWYEIRTVVGNMFSDFINGKVDMETAIKTADQKIREYLKEEYGE
ncbi:extracellular solute-binding protein, family 1 [Thermotoga petrophila RKU-1]|uniref:Extracellular solute-binding protein, family 1 n=1 Tax=Thermotoga petrophila (strain ATCC BAA-488 / DSM 13995 / JCM 10881 / RKU-1) TaxID=390874 RepID=A5IJH8_THEP1|nr:ABC transporter substrate-binding protein [Thermotoga petrophila]ABQ46351.1 extracellular solute-binding protein, family 1 [Thermotoga petrophila RKU-1]